MQNETIRLVTNVVMVFSIGTWIILGIGGFVLFHLWKNVASKKKWFPRFLILEGVLFVFISTATTALHFRSLWSLCVLVFLSPAVAVITYLGIKLTKFCVRCGAVIYNGTPFFPDRYCSTCGAATGVEMKSDRDSQH